MDKHVPAPRRGFIARLARGLRGTLFALGILAPALPALAGERCQLATIDMPVTLVGSRAVATVGIGGTQVPMTVDSGAFYSMLTEAAAQQLQLKVQYLPGQLRIVGITGEVNARMTTVDRLQFAHGEAPNIEFIVGGNEPGAGTMGLLGRNLLTFTDIEFDLANGMIRLVVPRGDCSETNMAYWASADTPVNVLPLRHTSRSRVPPIEASVKVNGHAVRAVFDTGATTILTLRTAHAANIADADMKPSHILHGAGAGEGKSWTAKVDRLEIGDETIVNSRLAVGDFDEPDVLLGIDFFLSHHIYVSKKQHRMYLTYNGGPVFALNKTDAQSPAAASAAGDDAALDAEGLARRGAARAARHDYAGALADLDRACELAPQVAANFTRRGDVHLALHQAPQALADFETALRLDPAQFEARLRRAGMRVAAHQRDDALADLQALDRGLPPQSNFRRGMAGLYTALDRPAQALPQWTQWLAAHPHEVDRDEVLNSSCWVRLRLGDDLPKALADCDDAIDQAQSEHASYYDSRGWVQLRRGEWRAARSDFDRAIKLQPEGAWSFYGRSLVNARLGQADAARADLEAARKLQKDIDEAVRNAGVAGALLPPAPAPVAAAAPATSDTAH